MRFYLASFVSVAALAAALPAQAELNFNRIASFNISDNLPEATDRATETSAEIIDVTKDGMTLIYTDSPLGAIGFIDITDAAAPAPGGILEMGGEPTSVAIDANGMAYIGVNTSESYVEAGGRLAAVNVVERTEAGSCDLGGQPDSVAVAPDGSFVTVAIENERDEDLDDGVIPQMPAGYVAIVPLKDGAMDCDGLIKADVTGLAEIAPSDPEPEFVDVNGNGEIVVSLQENNHMVVLNSAGEVLSHFSAGSVDLEGIDAIEDRALIFTDTQEGRKREPDAIQWIGNDLIATANEGDYEGGSRSFTIFNRDGSVVYENGTGFEQALIQLGHYPEKRSDSKGVEPEGMEVGQYGDQTVLFVMAERASAVGVYDVNGTDVTLRQILPSGIGPEGIKAIADRNLVVTANEVDLIEDNGPRAHVMIYEQTEAPASYPSITSEGADELIGWGALSGLAADAETPGKLYAVNDSFYRSQPAIFEIDATQTPARIVKKTVVTRDGTPAQKLDLEGIALDGDGGFWLASEGRTDRLTPHALYHVNADGEIKQEIAFPSELLAVEKRFGAEGITKVGDTLWIAIQREWKDDPADHVKLVSYNTDTKEWGAVLYPKAAVEKGWTGLSEIMAHGDYFYVIERDNQINDRAAIKKLYRIPAAEMTPAPLGGELPVVSKEEVHDFLPDLAAPMGFVVDKIEGFTVDAAGNGFAVTDNDGVDDSSGETHFIRLGGMN